MYVLACPLWPLRALHAGWLLTRHVAIDRKFATHNSSHSPPPALPLPPRSSRGLASVSQADGTAATALGTRLLLSTRRRRAARTQQAAPSARRAARQQVPPVARPAGGRADASLPVVEHRLESAQHAPPVRVQLVRWQRMRRIEAV